MSSSRDMDNTNNVKNFDARLRQVLHPKKPPDSSLIKRVYSEPSTLSELQTTQDVLSAAHPQTATPSDQDQTDPNIIALLSSPILTPLIETEYIAHTAITINDEQAQQPFALPESAFSTIRSRPAPAAITTPVRQRNPAPSPMSDLSTSPTQVDQVTAEYIKGIFKDWAYHGFILFLVIPSGMNTLCASASIKPAQLFEQWKDLSPTIRHKALIDAGFSINVNFNVQKDFLHEAGATVFASIRSRKKLKANLPYLIGTACAGYTFFAITHDVFESFGEATAVSFALASFISSSVTRLPTIMKVVRIIKASYNEDMCFQKDMARRLRKLNDHYTKVANNFIMQLKSERNPQEQESKLNHQDILKLLDYLGQESAHQSYEQIFKEDPSIRTRNEQVLHISRLLLTAVLVTTAFQLFTQKEFDAANITAKYLGYSLDNIDRSTKFFIGLPGGIVSSATYGLFAYNIIPYVLEVLTTLQAHAQKASAEINTSLLPAMYNTTKNFIQAPIQSIRTLWDNPDIVKEPLYSAYNKTIEFIRSPGQIASYYWGIYGNWRGRLAMVTPGINVAHNKEGIFATTTLAPATCAAAFPVLCGVGGTTLNTTSTFNQIAKHYPQTIHQVAKHLEEFSLAKGLAKDAKKPLIIPKIKASNGTIFTAKNYRKLLERHTMFAPPSPENYTALVDDFVDNVIEYNYNDDHEYKQP